MANNEKPTGTLAPKPRQEIKSLLESDGIKSRINEILGERAAAFTTSVIQLVNQSTQLAECDAITVVNAAMTAATLDLPLNNSLGLAYVIPYNVKEGNGWVKKAQFQLGYKGFKQLAMRTGQFLSLSQTDVREGEMVKRDRLRGTIEFNWNDNDNERLKLPIVGYVSFFQLSNGFTSTFYMSDVELEAHAIKYSKTYAKDKTGLWKTDRPAMCEKTVTKLNISKNAPLSIEDVQSGNLVRAINADQAVIKDFGNKFDYVDNDSNETDFTVSDPKTKADNAVDATMEKIGKNAADNKG